MNKRQRKKQQNKLNKVPKYFEAVAKELPSFIKDTLTPIIEERMKLTHAIIYGSAQNEENSV